MNLLRLAVAGQRYTFAFRAPAPARSLDRMWKGDLLATIRSCSLAGPKTAGIDRGNRAGKVICVDANSCMVSAASEAPMGQNDQTIRPGGNWPSQSDMGSANGGFKQPPSAGRFVSRAARQFLSRGNDLMA
jgi:hypothetical protein